jgi:hypothetical protein
VHSCSTLVPTSSHGHSRRHLTLDCPVKEAVFATNHCPVGAIRANARLFVVRMDQAVVPVQLQHEGAVVAINLVGSCGIVNRVCS